MRFEWDESKSRANLRNHGVSFETASLVFSDPFHLSIQDRLEGGELRWQTMGSAGGVVILIVAHTYKGEDAQDVVRIISARKATKSERRAYEEG